MKRLHFKTTALQEKKRTRPLTRDIYLRTWQIFLYLHWVSSSGEIMWRSHIRILRNTFKGFGTDPSPLLPLFPRPEDAWTTEKSTHPCPPSRERFGRNELPMKTKLEASPSQSSRVLSSHRCHKIQPQNGHGVLHPPARPNPCRANSVTSALG